MSKVAEKTTANPMLNNWLSFSSGSNGAGKPEFVSTEKDDELEFIVASPVMRKLQAQIRRVAAIDVPVLCLGESGTGKEVVARTLHQWSLRAHQPFLKVNCAALPAELLESELFGYETGAFTGAVRAKPGKFELCNRGTIFLDEIAEMPVALQAKLLHVLQDHQFSRLGGCSRIKVNVRIVAATNVDVARAVAAKLLREDLYYRLSTVVFRIPPLRERREEIPVLIEHFLTRFAGRYGVAREELSPELADFCNRYSWPGNIRQLENIVKRYLILGEEGLLDRLEPASGEVESGPDDGRPAEGLKATIRGLRNDAERAAISRALLQTNWNRKQASELLKISYKALLGKIRQFDLEGASRSGELDVIEEAGI